MRKIPASIAALLLLTACGNGSSESDNAAGKPVLLTSVVPQTDIIKEIAGEGYTVMTMLDRGADPESFDPAPDRLRRAADADIYFATGVLPFEERIRTALPDDVRVLSLADSVDLITGTHGDELETDPHIWTSARTLRAMARQYCSALSDICPDSTSAYTERRDAVIARIDSVDAAVGARLSGAPHAFGVWHPSLSYFARDYGLRQISVGAGHKETSPRHLRAAIDSLRASGATVVFFENEGERARVEAICENAGTRAVGLQLGNGNPIDNLNIIADEIARPQ